MLHVRFLLTFAFSLLALTVPVAHGLTPEQRAELHEWFIEGGYQVAAELELPDAPFLRLMGHFDFAEYQRTHPEVLHRIPLTIADRYLDDVQHLKALPIKLQNRLTRGLQNLNGIILSSNAIPGTRSDTVLHTPMTLPEFTVPSSTPSLSTPGPAVPHELGTILDVNGRPLQNNATIIPAVPTRGGLILNENTLALGEWVEVRRRWLTEVTPAERREAIMVSQLSARDKNEMIAKHIINFLELKLKPEGELPAGSAALFKNLEYDYDVIFVKTGEEIPEFRHGKPYVDERRFLRALEQFAELADVWDWLQSPLVVMQNKSLSARAPSYHFHLSRRDVIPMEHLDALNVLRLAQGLAKGVNYLEDFRRSRVVFQDIHAKGLLRRISDRHFETRNQLESPEDELYHSVKYLREPDLIYAELTQLLPQVFTVERFKIILTEFINKLKEFNYPEKPSSVSNALAEFRAFLSGMWAVQARTGFDFTPNFARAVAELQGIRWQGAKNTIRRALRDGRFFHPKNIYGESDDYRLVQFLDTTDSVTLALLAFVSMTPSPEYLDHFFDATGSSDLKNLFMGWKEVRSSPEGKLQFFSDSRGALDELFSQEEVMNALMSSKNPEVMDFVLDLILGGHRPDRSGTVTGSALILWGIHNHPANYEGFNSNDNLLAAMTSRFVRETAENQDIIFSYLMPSFSRNPSLQEIVLKAEPGGRVFQVLTSHLHFNASINAETEALVAEIARAHPDGYTRAHAVRNLRNSYSKNTIKFVESLLRDPSSEVREAAVETYAFLRRRDTSLPVLIPLLAEETDQSVSHRIVTAIRKNKYRPSLSQERQLLHLSQTIPYGKGLRMDFLAYSHHPEILAAIASEVEDFGSFRVSEFKYHLLNFLSEAKPTHMFGRLERPSQFSERLYYAIWLALEKLLATSQASEWSQVISAFASQSVAEYLAHLHPGKIILNEDGRYEMPEVSDAELSNFVEGELERVFRSITAGGDEKATNCSTYLDLGNAVNPQIHPPVSRVISVN